MVTITKHYMDRAKERSNIKNMATIKRNAQLAIERGKKADDFRGRERNYLLKKQDRSCIAIVYNGKCYIVRKDNNVVITCYGLPEWFEKNIFYDGKEMIRDVRKYCRMNVPYWDRQLPS